MKIKKILKFLIKINSLKVGIKLILSMGCAVTHIVPCGKLPLPMLILIKREVVHTSLALFLRQINTLSILHTLCAYVFSGDFASFVDVKFASDRKS